MGRQGLHAEAVQMATEELEKSRSASKRRAEAIMLLALAETKAQVQIKESCEEAVQHGVQARSAFGVLRDRKLEGESCLAIGNAHLRLEGKARHGQAALDVFQSAFTFFQEIRSLQLQGRAMHGMAASRAAIGQLDPALQDAQTALGFFRQAQSIQDEVAELDAIAIWLHEAGHLQKALQFAEQSLAVVKESQCSAYREARSLQTYIQVNVAMGNGTAVAGTALEAVTRFRQANVREAEAIALTAAVNALAAQDDSQRLLQVAAEACMLFQELGQKQSEVKMLCKMAQLHQQRGQFVQAASRASQVLDMAKKLGCRAERAQALSILAQAELNRPDGGPDKAVECLEEERKSCRADGDGQSEAVCLLTSCQLSMESSRYMEALAAAEEAKRLFKAAGDKAGELAAMQIVVDVYARSMQYAKACEAAEKTLAMSESMGDVQAEASLLVTISQASMGSLETSREAPSSAGFKEAVARAGKAAKKAVTLARKVNQKGLMASALCALSQAHLLAGEREEARKAAVSAATVCRGVGDLLGEANALVVVSNAYILMGKAELAKQTASKALLMFQEQGDLIGEDMAKAALDAIENPVAANQGAASGGKVRVVVRRQRKQVDPEVFREKVRNVVSEIVGMDSLMDDTPLMQSGLTSQSAVLLRNALTKEIPGPSLPFTLMFDYPSISDLSSFFVDNSEGGGDEEVEEWIEVDASGEAAATHAVQGAVRTGPSPEDLRKQVKEVVAEIVGMDDLVDDTPLMQSGLTSQSAVLLRNALSKKLPGASLPFTMMFDYPSISALTEFFVERTVPEVGASPAPAAQQASQAQVIQRGPAVNPEEIHRKVRQTVEEIIGMDDFTDDAALMQHGLTSQNTVLLRDALSKQFTGPSMPHTMIFDYPSVMDLTDFIIERAQR
eukprot:TRINITY_DN29351_c0_g2_i1.p1 TRINITY_DN29351_c0_g2~~TRINITY_DN29351_c0_g2_i1.p1  ORF type:complete len:981 (+),score=257.11 TRINITY_DN29351_c0_g2_i1:236-2944(+)